jgi:PAS domain S-box-containing protein
VKKKASQRKARAPVPPHLLASALAAQGDGVIVARIGPAAPSFKIVFANENFRKMTGYSSADLDSLRLDALHPGLDDLAKIVSWQSTARPGRVFTGEGFLLGRRSGPLYAAWTFSAIFKGRGRMTHLVATYRDMTEIQHRQDSLIHAQRLDAVGRLAGGVAHDFHNLLSVINGYCEILAAQVVDRPQALQEVNEIHKAGLQAATLTRQLLAFGRGQPMDVRVIDLNRLVNAKAGIMSRLLGPAGRLELELAENLHRVRVDPAQFQQVLLNLVINARDALRGQGRVTIATSNREIVPGHNRNGTPPGRYVCLTVADNGTGMDAETQKHLFEPFFTTKPKGQGTGLGLALVYGVVQQSGGHIKFHSVLLAGSTFEILLPVVHAPEDPTPSGEGAPVAPLPATKGHETLMILEVDAVVRKMVSGMLTADGYRVLAGTTSAECLELARAQPRPVQLLIANPQHGGLALTKALRSAYRDLRMICISNGRKSGPLPGLRPKHQASMAKPYALSEILLTVRRLLDA